MTNLSREEHERAIATAKLKEWYELFSIYRFFIEDWLEVKDNDIFASTNAGMLAGAYLDSIDIDPDITISDLRLRLQERVRVLGKFVKENPNFKEENAEYLAPLRERIKKVIAESETIFDDFINILNTRLETEFSENKN